LKITEKVVEELTKGATGGPRLTRRKALRRAQRLNHYLVDDPGGPGGTV
jgi:hypothetical protein